MQLEPLRDVVFVVPVYPEKSKGGVWLSKPELNRTSLVRVVFASPDAPYKKGDQILIPVYGRSEVPWEGSELWAVNGEDVLAVLEP